MVAATKIGKRLRSYMVVHRILRSTKEGQRRRPIKTCRSLEELLRYWYKAIQLAGYRDLVTYKGSLCHHCFFYRVLK